MEGVEIIFLFAASQIFPTALIAVADALLYIKKIKEPYIILVAAIIQLILKTWL